MKNSPDQSRSSCIVGGIIVHTSNLAQAQYVSALLRQEGLKNREVSGVVHLSGQEIHWEKLYPLGAFR